MSVTVRPNGTGTVAVSVRLDQAAQLQVGNLARQLQTGDLVRAGWTVTGPRSQPDGAEVVSASKPFRTPVEASDDVASLAGSGPSAARPFELTVTRHHTFWHTETAVRGVVDLTCGVGCFGDVGLARQLGSSVGVDVGAASAASGETPLQALTFAFRLQLPGRAHATGATGPATTPGPRPPGAPLASGAVAVSGGTVTWRPILGQRSVLAASSRSTNASAVVTVAAAAGLLLIVVILLGRRLTKGRSRPR